MVTMIVLDTLLYTKVVRLHHMHRDDGGYWHGAGKYGQIEH